MTIEEIKVLSGENCEARLAEIRTELNDEDADIEALSAEVDAIEERKAELVKAEESRKALAEKVAQSATTEVMESRKENKKMKNKKNKVKSFQ